MKQLLCLLCVCVLCWGCTHSRRAAPPPPPPHNVDSHDRHHHDYDRHHNDYDRHRHDYDRHRNDYEHHRHDAAHTGKPKPPPHNTTGHGAHPPRHR